MSSAEEVDAQFRTIVLQDCLGRRISAAGTDRFDSVSVDRIDLAMYLNNCFDSENLTGVTKTSFSNFSFTDRALIQL
jgi:hypothetical protein